MNFDAWQTVWICVALSVLVLALDGVLAFRSGPDKTELARKSQRGRRMARVGKGSAQ
jgi:heme exporter protein D